MSVIVNMYADDLIFFFFKPKSGIGTSLLSGGVESVLVLWRNESDCQKDFLPRLGSPIEYISMASDGTLCCTLHTDNSKPKFILSIP